jgi:hypothetical protein
MLPEKTNENENFEDPNTGTVYRDLITISLLIFVSMVILLLIIVNPSKKKEDTKIPGYMNIELAWDNNADVDVDLWVKAPNENPIGYPNKHSLSLDLVRDDLGLKSDPMPYNMEHVFSRGIYKEEEYVVNLHVYNWRTEKSSIIVTLKIEIKDEKGNISDLYLKKIQLTFEDYRKEITLLRFEIDENLKFNRSSFNDEYFAIREGEFVQFDPK